MPSVRCVIRLLRDNDWINAENAQPGGLCTRHRRQVTQLVGIAGEGTGHVRMLLGAYILGGLSEHEEYSVRAHLRRCAKCRAEHDELAEVLPLLDLLAAEEAGGGFGDLATDPGDDGDRGA